MEHAKKLEDLNRESLAKLEEFVKARQELGKEHHEKLHQAKEEWQASWNKLMEVLMVLERLEI